MGLSLSQIGRRYLMNAEKVRKEIDCPVLVWELPTDGSPSDDRKKDTVEGVKKDDLSTEWGGPEEKPQSGNPLVFLLKSAIHGNSTDELVIGRGSGSDLMIEDPTVSRSHAMLKREGKNGWAMVDLGSRNGSAINGSKVNPNAPAALSDRCRIKLGNVDLLFMLPETFFSYVEKKASR